MPLPLDWSTFKIRGFLYKHTAQSLWGVTAQPDKFSESQGRQDQAALAAPLNLEHAAGHTHKTASIRDSMSDVRLFTKIDQTLNADQQSLSISSRWKPFSEWRRKTFLMENGNRELERIILPFGAIILHGKDSVSVFLGGIAPLNIYICT